MLVEDFSYVLIYKLFSNGVWCNYFKLWTIMSIPQKVIPKKLLRIAFSKRVF